MVLLFAWVAHSRTVADTPFVHSLLIVFFNALIFFSYGYITVYLLIPSLLSRGKILFFILTFIACGLVLSGLKFLFSDYIFFLALSPGQASSLDTLSLPAVLVNTKDMTFIVALFAIAKYARDRYLLKIHIQELEEKEMEAELRLLEHQMDPHVIFNNFNNLYSISINRPDLLATTVAKLRSVLNYLFKESKYTMVPLASELNMIENYIGLEKLRYGDRLKISYQCEGEPGRKMIAPLILYPFVENCFVHGAGEDPRKSWIEIRISIDEGRLTFFAANSVRRSFNPKPETAGNGANLNSIRRLEIQYPNSHRLAIRERNHEHEVNLNIRL
jgi:sensor histidine kinase YesM